MAEIWDAYDRQFHKIENITLIRGQNIEDGMYHLVSEIIVKHRDGTYLLMQRDPRKRHGGKWELTAGGSALKGETPHQCALRELREETGIRPSHLQEIGRLAHDGNHACYVVYLCLTDGDKTAVTLQPGETVAYQWITKEALLQIGKAALASDRAWDLLLELDI